MIIDETKVSVFAQEEKIIDDKKEKNVQSDMDAIVLFFNENTNFNVNDFSPFSADFWSESDDGILELFNSFFLSPSGKELSVLPLEFRKEVCSRLIEKTIGEFRKNKMALLTTGMFVEGEYEKKRLSYIVETGKEAVLFLEKDFEFLFLLLESLFVSVLNTYYGTTENEDEYKSETQLMMEYHMKCLKRFDNIAKRYEIEIRDYYMNKIDNLTSPEKLDYSCFSICPITCNLLTDYNKKSSSMNDFILKQLAEICGNIESVRKLVRPENFNIIIDNVCWVGEEYQNITTIYSEVRKPKVNLENVEKILNLIPTINELVKNEK